jgi:hypothetical protein
MDRCLHLKPHHAEVHLYSAALNCLANDLSRARRHLDLLSISIEPWMQTLGCEGLSGSRQGPFNLKNHPGSSARGRGGHGGGLAGLPQRQNILTPSPGSPGADFWAKGQGSSNSSGILAKPCKLKTKWQQRQQDCSGMEKTLLERPKWNGQRGAATGGPSGGQTSPRDRDRDAMKHARRMGITRLTMQAPLPLDSSVFDSRAFESVQLLRQKVMLLATMRL